LVTACGQETIDKALSDVEVIVCDTDYTGTTEYADLILPIATAVETDGTFTNYAGRVQRVRQAFPPPGEARIGWELLSQLSARLGGTEHVSITEVFADLTKNAPTFAGLTYGKLGSQGLPLPGIGAAAPQT
jgi:predicted molibdopterin-dependent oxidoreductase YjgC